MTEFQRYQRRKTEGAQPLQVLREASQDGLAVVSRIRMMRQRFGLSLVDAKRIVVEEESGRSLEELQDALVEPLARVLEDDESG